MAVSRPDAAARTLAFYEENADAYAALTLGLDVADRRERFLAHVPPGGRILDAGCGAGRDAKAFLERGFRVDAFDASPALAAIAKRHAGIPVEVADLETFEPRAKYDGIWCMSSLLHLSPEAEARVLERLARALVPGGVLYVSYKEGPGCRIQEGRFFRDHTEESLFSLIEATPGLVLVDFWKNAHADTRRTETFLNAIARRVCGPEPPNPCPAEGPVPHREELDP